MLDGSLQEMAKGILFNIYLDVLYTTSWTAIIEGCIFLIENNPFSPQYSAHKRVRIKSMEATRYSHMHTFIPSLNIHVERHVSTRSSQCMCHNMTRVLWNVPRGLPGITILNLGYSKLMLDANIMDNMKSSEIWVLSPWIL